MHFSGLRLREEVPHGQVYEGQDETGASVTVAMLGVGPASDPTLRNAFADVVWRHSVGSAPQGALVYAADLHAPQPWAAVRDSGDHGGAELLLAELAELPPGAAHSTIPSAGGAVSLAGGAVPPGGGDIPPGGGTIRSAGGAVPLAGGGAAPGRGALPWLVAAGAAVALVALLVVGTVVALRLSGDEIVLGPTPGPANRPIAGASPGSTGGASPQPAEPGDGVTGAGRPQWRETVPISVLGPTYRRTEETYTMAFPGWPFAFRTPLPWTCVRGDWEQFSEALVWSCVGEEGDEQLLNVLLWKCPTRCTFQEQLDMMDQWLDAPELAERGAEMPETYYVETEQDSRGMYSVDLAHFSAGPDGGALKWLVGVYVESPPATRDDVLKILNDIITQAS